MGVQITSEKSKALLKARLDLHLTQLELSQKAGISLRSIADIENCRRSVYNEDTIIRLCRALGVSYEQMFNSSSQEQPTRPISNTRFTTKRLLLIAVLLIFLGLVVWTVLSWKGTEQYKRTDWILDLPLTVDPNPPNWGNRQAMIVSFYKYNTPLHPGDTVKVDLGWYYRYVNDAYTEVFVNAFGDWAPDTQIPIYHGVLHGDSSKVVNFTLKPPAHPKVYIVRVFFATSFSPVPSFYGHAPPSQLGWTSSAAYVQFPVEVIAK